MSIFSGDIMKRFLSVFLTIAVLSTITCKTTSNGTNKKLFGLVEQGNIEELKKKVDSTTVNAVDVDGTTLLHSAVLNGQDDIVTFLIEQGANVDAQDRQGISPLLLAVSKNNFPLANILTEHGANIFTTDTANRNPFKYTVERGTYPYLLNPHTIIQKDPDGNTALHHGVILKDRALVDFILTFGLSLNEKNNEGFSPLEVAYTNMSDIKSVEIASDILQAGATPLNDTYQVFETAAIKRNFAMYFDDGNTPLHIAARDGENGIALFLLDKNISIDAKNASNATALHEAVRNGNSETALLLLNAGADVNARDSFGNTPLHLVMPEASRAILFDMLLSFGADVSARDTYGEMPLHIAARIDMSDDIIQRLVFAGSDVNARNKKGETPLMIALERMQLNQAKLLVALGAHIHDEDNSGKSSYARAIDLGIDAIKILITSQNSNTSDGSGRSPLHTAIIKNASTEIVEYLLACNAQVNMRDKDGNTPLHIAVRQNQKEIGEMLLTHDADIFVANITGESPLSISYVLREGRPDWLINERTVHFVDTNGNTPLHLAAEWGASNMIQFLLHRGAHVNAKNENGETPFFSAVKGNSSASVDALLMSSQSEIDIEARDFLGNSILHTAVQWSAYTAAAKVISLIGSDKLVGARNLSGKTALQIAAFQGDMQFVQLFLQYGIDINETDDFGRSVLVYAINGNKPEMVLYLLSHGADVRLQDMYGQTPLYYCVQTKNFECVTLLRNVGANPMTMASNGTTPLSLAFKESLALTEAVLGNDTTLQNTDGNTPIQIAIIENASIDIVEHLLTKNYPLDKRNKDGNTALFLAVQGNKEKIIDLLLRNGADAFLANTESHSPVTLVLNNHKSFLDLFAKNLKQKADAIGDTFLHYASRLSDVETVAYLIDEGYSPHIENREGHTCLDMATRWGNKDVERYLRNVTNENL